MKATEYICYGCKGGDFQPLRIKVFGELEKCPTCRRPFHKKKETLTVCTTCQSPTDRKGLCASCAAERLR